MSDEKEIPKKVIKEEPNPKKEKKSEMIAVVLVRGDINLSKEVKDTLSMLSLHKRNFCSVHKATPSVRGMINKVKDYVTWGEISEDTLKDLIKSRSEPNPKDPKKTKKFFRLNSPKKSYGGKGIKLPFSKGGALGDRKDKINDLIKRML